MSLFRKNESKREQPEEGTHPARLLSIVDMGHQPGFSDGKNTYESKWKLEFTYELVNTSMSDGRPFVVSEMINNNNWEDTKKGMATTLVSRAKALLGREYKGGLEDPTRMLGAPCMVAITYNDNGYAQVRGASAVGSIPVGYEVKELHNSPSLFTMEDPDMDKWESFPDFKKDRITSALNFHETQLAKELAEGDQYK